MSIATYLDQIITDRNEIRDKLVELGLATTTDKLTALAEAVASIIDQGAVSVTVQEGQTYTIPKGYHNGSGTVSAVAGGGNYNLQSKTVTPTKKQQNLTPDEGFYGLSDVTVQPIPSAYQDVTSVTATAPDVLVGKIIVTSDGTVVTGSMPNIQPGTQILDATVITYTIPKGYHDGTGTVKITLEQKTVTPTKAAQIVSASAGKVISSVTVNPIPDNFIDTGDADATAAEILAGSTAYVDGELVEGTMPNNGAVSKTIDGLTTTSTSIPAGYTTGGTVSLTDDIEQALAAI